MLAFTSILFTALAAFAGISIWVVLVGAAVLFSISFREQHKFAARSAHLSISHVLTMGHWQGAGHALLASGAAFGVGALSRWALLSI